MFGFGRARRARKAAAERLYAAAVARAREPVFYARLGVADTPEGRFEMIALHGFAVMRRLKSAGAPGAELSQDVFDVLFTDLDRNLREMGVGDLAVGKRIKRLVTQFYGRVLAYEQGLAAGEAALADILARNIYAGAGPSAPELASYVFALDRSLAAHDGAELLAGRLIFPPPPAE